MMSNTSTLPSTLSTVKPFTLDSAAVVLATILVIVLSTRFLSGTSGDTAVSDDRTVRRVPRVPYYFPILGHIFEFCFNNAAFLHGLRNASTRGIFALNLYGYTHNIVSSPSLADGVRAQDDAVLDQTAFTWFVLRNAFRLPAKLKSEVLEVQEKLQRLLPEYLEGRQNSKSTASIILRNTQEHLPNLVTFNSSLVDQTEWERVSNTHIIKRADGEAVVETSLLPLIHDVLNAAVLPSMLGPSFLESFSYPDFTADLQTLSSSFHLLASGLPRWVPLPGLVPAHLARKRLLEALIKFYHSINSNSYNEEQPPLLLAKNKTYASHNLPISARASLTLSLLWTLTAQIHALSFWLLLHIFSTPDLPARLLAETAPFVRATQPPNDFGIPEPPRLTIDIEGLRSKCPLLRSCYIETVRLDARVWSIGKAKRDFAVQESEDDAVGGRPERWRITSGEWVDVAHWLHHTDPAYFVQPMVWMPERHVRPAEEAGGVRRVEWGSVKGFGDGGGSWKIESFTERICLAFVAGVLALWEIEPASWRGWKIPKKGGGFMVPMPNKGVRVRIKRRSLQSSGSSFV